MTYILRRARFERYQNLFVVEAHSLNGYLATRGWSKTSFEDAATAAKSAVITVSPTFLWESSETVTYGLEVTA